MVNAAPDQNHSIKYKDNLKFYKAIFKNKADSALLLMQIGIS